MRFIIFLVGMMFPAAAHAQIVISEVMWVGTEISTADEWLTIVNISDERQYLEGWSITKRASDGSHTAMITFEEDVELAPGQKFLISNYPRSESALDAEPDLVTSSVSLHNTKLLLRVINAEGEVVDTVDDGVGEPFAGGKDPLSLMSRIDLHFSGEQKTNWKSVPLLPLHSSSSSSSSDSSSSFSLPSIVISEVLPNPKGSDDYEWIEIANRGMGSVDIANWTIKTGTRSYKIPARSSSGYTLKPGEHTVFFHYQTGLKLPSSEGQIFLYDDDIMIDDLPYSSVGEEVSFGRGEDGSRELYCIPTPRKENTKRALEPFITVQSGRTTDYTKATVNLKAEVKEGSLQSAKCYWDFRDGTSSKKCNPPSHSWDYYGVYPVELTVQTMCGDEIRKTIDIVVLQKEKYRKHSEVSSSISSSHSSSVSITLSMKSSEKSSAVSVLTSRSSFSNDQKLYSNNSSIYRAKFKNRYVNISKSDTASSLSSMEQIYANLQQKAAHGNKDQNEQNVAIPWMLLFTQSALVVGVAGWKMIY